MKRIAWLVFAVLCSAILTYAADPPKTEQLTGTICDAKCVTQNSNTATCDPNCSEKSGRAVFVDDNGSVMQVTNQSICKSHMGKHVKMMATPTENQREQSIRIQTLEEEHL